MDQNPKKVVVLYWTKYGSTRRYAQWIADRTHADLFDVSTFDKSLLAEYAVVLFGSPVFLGRLRYIRFVKRNWGILSTKRVIIFGVSGIPPDDPRQEKMFQTSLPDEIRSKVTCFPLRGAFHYGELSLLDKMLMSGPRIRLQIEVWTKRNQEARERMARFFSLLDWTSEAAIEPIVATIDRISENGGPALGTHETHSSW